MKNNLPKLILLTLGLISGISLCQTQFSAQLTDVTRGNKKIYQLRSDGTRYRFDFEASGMKGTVIVDPASEKTTILMPDCRKAWEVA